MNCPFCDVVMKGCKVPIGSSVARFYKSDNVIEYTCPWCGIVKWGIDKDFKEIVVFT